MLLNSRYIESWNLDLTITFAILYPAVFSASILNMYSAHHLDIPSKTEMKRMYSTNSTLKGEDNMSNPKKDNMFQSMFNVLNGIWEHVSKVPGTFMANLNSPLSVTVVQNEGIISHEFFKSLTSRREPLTTDHVYTHNTPTKESLNIVESIHCSMFDDTKPYANSIFNEKMNENLKSDYVYIDTENNGFVEKFDKIGLTAKESFDIPIGNDKLKTSNTDCNATPFTNSTKEHTEESLECICSHIITNNIMQDFHNCTNTEIRDICKNKQFSSTVDANVIKKTQTDIEFFPQSSQTNSVIHEKSINQAPISNLLTNMWQKVVDGVTDRLYLRTESLNSDKMMKRSISPKQRRKLNTVAKGRGRGRARSQLRRSGVSQTRHRKERTKHDLLADIHDDYESWQEIDMFTVQCQDSLDCFALEENGIDIPDAPEFIIKETISPMVCPFADIKMKNRKPKIRKTIDQNTSKFPLRVRYVPECAMETNAYPQDYNERKYDLQRNAFRPRLLSESSVDSEDSYCIVFETGSETNYKPDYDDNEESDEDQSIEDEESVSTFQKVKFNLKPKIHVMVKWDYAYRAARRGPWEEMARDRERFRGRINCIGRVLNPILMSQHRTHIWQERFAFTE